MALSANETVSAVKKKWRRVTVNSTSFYMDSSVKYVSYYTQCIPQSKRKEGS